MDETRIQQALRQGPPFRDQYMPQQLSIGSEVEASAIAAQRRGARARPWALIVLVVLLGLLVGGIVVVGSGIFRPARPAVWTVTGSMVEAYRVGHTATLLPDGRVLAAGGSQGFSETSTFASAELYDPDTGRWTRTAAMAQARWQHTATLLPDGKVLVVGGAQEDRGTVYWASAEVYDPANGRWEPIGQMEVPRASHTATLLPNGLVLVSGGLNQDGLLSSAELYDPDSGSWTATGDMHSPRAGHTATLLGDGHVLVAGSAAAGNAAGFGDVVATAELYDPETGTWSTTSGMAVARRSATATLLRDGRVLIIGGSFGGSSVSNGIASAELYDPASGVWSTAASMRAARQYHTATLLTDGTVLVAGGFGSAIGEIMASAEVYDPADDTWSVIGDMHDARASHSATLLSNGIVLVAGVTAEQYGPAALPAHSNAPEPSTTAGETAGPGDSAAPVFADQGPVTCRNPEGGYSIEVPAGWWYLITNDTCGYLDPEPFQFDGATPQGPVTIRISVVQAEVGTFYETVSLEEISIAGHSAVRLELRAGGEEGGPPAGTLIYEYIVQLGPTSEGPNLVAYTDSASQPDYEQNKLVLNAIMATLTTP
jgi:N-acetylneuraminic acid mutarotase